MQITKLMGFSPWFCNLVYEFRGIMNSESTNFGDPLSYVEDWHNCLACTVEPLTMLILETRKISVFQKKCTVSCSSESIKKIVYLWNLFLKRLCIKRPYCTYIAETGMGPKKKKPLSDAARKKAERARETPEQKDQRLKKKRESMALKVICFQKTFKDCLSTFEIHRLF